MEKFRITIETVNAAFEDIGELPRILRKVADTLEDGDIPQRLLDINGNVVGIVEYE